MEPQVQLREMLSGFVVSRALQVAAELGIADALEHGAMTCEALADATGAHAPSLYRLLRLLASHGVFEQLPGARFRNNPMSEYLRDDMPGSLRGTGLMYGDTPMWRAWEGLLHSVRTGESSFRHIHGVSTFEYLAAHAQSAARFDQAMTSSSEAMNLAIVEAYDWRQVGTLVDVGGGVGSTLAAILGSAEHLKGVLFDLPHVIERARETLMDSPVLPRCHMEAGDFFQGVPAGGDAYFLKHILHDWDDHSCQRILAACNRAMPVGGKVLICEKVIDGGGGQQLAKRVDLVMLAFTEGGRERTAAAFAHLLAVSGFRLLHTIPTPVENCILEAVKV